ncbi:hypothetical protein PSQ90_06125 [Devosia rhodophyticola]|uniref:Uncharacterized protein n=1 Tax=Devosia rhodophyticola TaxID=3026423 RepID=A0ABY7Z054_9HYPH|nr:hypothetical protein [Devosia rhodophyticola]WDR07013.1 hypothetical protein PSQ90_06125 [Devosia rhodophyticola]
MATGSRIQGGDVVKQIAAIINQELSRQGHPIGGLDVAQLARAIVSAMPSKLGSIGPVSEGKHPTELNATNDD